MRIRYAARTDVGLKRMHNEDYFALIEDVRLFMVADGMGGHASGDVASKLATEVIGDFFRHSRNPDATWPYRYDASRSYPENRLIAAIRLANERIYEASQANRSQRGMGTTIVVLHLNGDECYVGHVGDSRCYLVRDHQLRVLTRDHSLLEDWKEARPDLTAEEIRDFPHKNVITRALGMRDVVEVDVCRLTVHDGDRFLLCSDGLSGMLRDEAILEVVESHPQLDDVVTDLIDRANALGGDDNITALAVECQLRPAR